MIQAKICLLGSFCVGKTSLVRRFVKSEFSDRYITTVGVRVDRKTVVVESNELTMLIWDIHGEDRFQSIRPSFMRGASGNLLVIDGTRRETLGEAISVRKEAERIVGDVPWVVLVNKTDLVDQQALTQDDLAKLGTQEIIFTSAKTGDNVDLAFHKLANAIFNQRQDSAVD